MAVRVRLAAVVLAFLAGATAPPVVSGGASTGEVVFELTIQGPMPDDEGFLLDVECEGDVPLCDPPGNYICVAEPIIDTPPCGDPPTTVVASGELAPQAITWRLFRVTGLPIPEEMTLVLSGSWTVHPDRQVLSLGYVYPDPGAPALPDTSMAPRD